MFDWSKQATNQKAFCASLIPMVGVFAQQVLQKQDKNCFSISVDIDR